MNMLIKEVEITLVFSISVHGVQGAKYLVVILPLPMQYSYSLPQEPEWAKRPAIHLQNEFCATGV